MYPAYNRGSLPRCLDTCSQAIIILHIMAKSFVRKRTAGKGRYVKKKTSGRVAKKGGTVSSAKMKSIVAGEVQKVLNSGVHNERRKVTMELNLVEGDSYGKCVYINGKGAMLNSIRIPITAAIPAQQGAQHAPDVRRRRANKIVVTGVNVRASIAVSDETRVMIVPYEPHDSVRPVLEKLAPFQLVPDAKAGHVPEKIVTQMVLSDNMGIVSKHGPLMTKKFGDGIALDSADGTPFESRVSTHAGKPIATPFRKKFGGGGLRRTQNWNQGGAEQVGMGYTAWSTHMVNEYWKLNRECTYMYEGMNDQVFDRNMEMFMYVDCPSLESHDIHEGKKLLVGAVIRKVIVDIYFHDK